MPRKLDTTFWWAGAGGALVWAALPPLGPLGLWPLAWIAPVPWVCLVRRAELPGRRPYAALWLVGFLFWMAATYWLCLPHWATSFGWVALSAYQAFYLPVFIALARAAAHRLAVPVILAAPAVWTGLELARGHLLTGFTMASLGHTQYRWIELIQISDLAGAYGVSFVVMFGGTCLGCMVPCEGRRWAFWPLGPLGGLVAAVLAYGYARTALPPPVPVARIALIQESIDITFKADPEMYDQIHRRYEALSQEAVSRYGRPQRLDLIVWPETMFRWPLRVIDRDAQVPADWEGSAERFRQWLRSEAAWQREAMGHLARQLGTAVLLGVDTIHYAADGQRHFNSAVMVSPEGEILGRYDKMHLVMFGEYVPFSQYFPWLLRLTPLSVTQTPGTEPAAFQVASLRLSPSICYENVLPHVIARQVRMLARQGREPHVLVNLTNDGWFWGSSELDMHLICAVFRAVECRKPFLVAANTGFSAWIDGEGRIRAQGPRRDKQILLAEVGADPRHSWYLQHGDWFAGCCLLGCVLPAGELLFRGFRRWSVWGRGRPVEP